MADRSEAAKAYYTRYTLDYVADSWYISRALKALAALFAKY